MKKIYLSLLIVLFGLGNAFSQNYSLNSANNHTTNVTCAAHVYNTYCTVIGTTTYYCEGIDRWQAFTNGTGAPIKLNITFLDLETGDKLRVYQGVGTGGTLLASYTFTSTTLGNVVLEPTGTITIRFTTDNDGWTAQGFDAIIGCEPTGCNGNSPAGDNCGVAPQICNLNGYCGNTSGWYTEDNPTLGGATSPGFTGSIENNSWINFVAGATTATLVVQSANCLSSSSGIQGVVYASTNCSTFTPIAGGSFNQSASAGTQTLSLTGLTAGQDYFLMLDGYGGNICDYTVTAAGNVQTLNTASSAASNTICPNQSFTVTATAGATSYNWNPTPVSTSSNTAVYNNISSTSVITTTAVGYCGASATVALTMSVVTTAVSITSGTICSGTSTVLTASGASTYSWSPNIGLSSTTGASVTVNPSTSIIYTVTGASGLCSNTNTTSLTVNLTPTTTASTTGTLTCLNTSVDLNSTLAGVSYTWSAPSGGNISSVNTQSTTASSAAGTYTLKVKSAAGCTYSATTVVSQNTLTPTSVASNSGTLTCAVTSINLNSTLAGMNYTWTAPSGGAVTNPNSQNATASLAGGIYSLAVVNPTNGCSYNTTTSVSQNTTVPTAIASNSGSITCSTSTINLNSSLPGMSYTWTAPAGGNVLNSNSQNANAYGAPGEYSLTVLGTNGCTYTTSTVVNENLVVPTGVDAGTAQILGCETASIVTLTGSVATPTNASILWTGAGFSTSQSVISVDVYGAGIYTLTATDPINGCVATSTVQVYPSPGSPTVTASATSGTITCTNTLVIASISTTVTPVTYEWSGPGIVGSNTSYSIAVNQGGTYNYTLTNTTNTACPTYNSVFVDDDIISPTIDASVAGELTCVTNSVTLSSTSSGVDFNWAAPNSGTLSTSNNSVTVASGAAGNYSLTIIDQVNGCSSSTVVAVSENTTAPVINAAVAGELTCSTNSVTLSSTSSGVDFNWTAPTNGTLSAATNSVTIASGVAGNYSLTLVDQVNGCSTSTTVAVSQNTNAPAVDATVTGVLTCATNTVSLSTSVGSMNYTWTAPAGGALTQINSQTTTASSSAGNYSLTIVDPLNGCFSSTVIAVTENTLSPTIDASVTGSITCATNTVSLSTNIGSMNYTWTAPAGGVVTQVNSQATIASSSAGNYSLTITDPANGCSSSTVVAVSENTVAPFIDAIVTGALTCSSLTATLSTSAAGMNYTWTAPVGGVLTQANNQTATAMSAAGNYSLTLQDPINGCVSSTVTTVKQNTTTPSTSASATGTITCLTNTVTLDASATGYDYNWTAAIGSSVSTSTDQSTTGTGPGPYTLSVTNPVNGCTFSITTIAASNIITPTLTVVDLTVPCTTTINIGALASNVSYLWTTLGSGSIISGSTIATPVVSGNVSGSYQVSVIDNSNGCANTATVNVTITPVVAAFSANPTSGIAPLLVDFTNQSTGATDYSWVFADATNNTSSAVNPSHTFSTTGTYVVTLTASNSGNCPSIATVSIDVFENATVVIPNVFTPNGDGKNDVFKIATTGLKDLNCTIFNRWGTKLYTIDTINGAWDGGDHTDGTYFYILIANGSDGKEIKQQGTVSLFR
jgi:gliding motility-associated-like protein